MSSSDSSEPALNIRDSTSESDSSVLSERDNDIKCRLNDDVAPSPPSPPRLVYDHSSPDRPRGAGNSQTPDHRGVDDPSTPNLIRGYIQRSPGSPSPRKRLAGGQQQSDDKEDPRSAAKRRLLETDELLQNVPTTSHGSPTNNESNNQSFHHADKQPPESTPEVSAVQQETECCEDSESESFDSRSEAGSENVEIDKSVGSCSESSATCESSCEEDSSSSSESDSGVSEQDDDDLLYPGSNHTVAEAVLKIMELYINHHWTQNSLKDTLKTFHDLLPETNQLPSSVHTLFEYVEKYSNVPSAKIYWYCSDPDCFSPKEKRDDDCVTCKLKESSKFFHFPLADQIKHLFEQRNLAKAINTFTSFKNKNVSEGINDITSGAEYLKVKSKLSGPYDIVLLWNTDGVSLSDSSTTSLWPILCTICEVSPILRPAYLLVAGVWCDSKNPPMNMFLEPFVNALVEIMEVGGVEWTDPSTGKKCRSLVVAPGFSGDAPAKAEVLNVQYFSSLYGCNTCEEKRSQVKVSDNENEKTQNKRKEKTGKKTKKAQKTVSRFVYKEFEAPLRSGPRMEQQGIEAERLKKTVKGVQGRSIVSRIPFFDRGHSVVAEYLHNCLLGVVKYFTSLWVYTSGRWFIGNNLKLIDKFLKGIRVTDFVHRLPRGLKELSHWKASEYRSWLLYYSLPALSGVLPDQYFQHWTLLVSAICLLLTENITDADLDTAKLLLRMFVRDVKHLYGPTYYTYNLHTILHLPVLVRRWGGLHSTSGFIFESYNSVLCGLIHGKRNKGQELVNKIKLSQGVICLKNFVERRKNRVSTRSRFTIVCCGRPIRMNLSCEQQLVLSDANLLNFPLYRRARIQGETYTSFLYDKKKKRSNSYVKFLNSNDQVGYAQIFFFVKGSDGVYGFLRIYDVEHVRILMHRQSLYQVRHLIPSKESNTWLVVSLTQMCCKVIKVGDYFAIRPNTVENNLSEEPKKAHRDVEYLIYII